MSSNTKRLSKELANFQKAGHNNIFLHAIDDDLMNIVGLIIVPCESKTPYDGGFMYFSIKPGQEYPNNPPKIKFLTPDSESCRLHPNLYANGKVCLSILGTWGTYEWSPLLTLEKILMTIQGILNDNPIINEPGQEKHLLGSEASENYNIIARWLTLRTVITMFNRDDVPNFFKGVMSQYFIKNINGYLASLKILEKYEGKSITCFHGPHVIQYEKLLKLYAKKYEELSEKSFLV
jgi:ubiquitin-protein ligase